MKNYTDIGQSEKLAEILSNDSADTVYIWHATSDNPSFRFDDDMPPMVLKDVPMIIEDHVSFEVAKLLKEKGFDWECIGYYVDDEPNDIKYSLLGETNSTWESRCCAAPTHQMAMRWLREIYGIDIVIEISDPSVNDRKYYCVIWDKNNDSYILDLFNSYEEAVDSALKYTLENIIL